MASGFEIRSKCPIPWQHPSAVELAVDPLELILEFYRIMPDEHVEAIAEHNDIDVEDDAEAVSRADAIRSTLSNSFSLVEIPESYVPPDLRMWSADDFEALLFVRVLRASTPGFRRFVPNARSAFVQRSSVTKMSFPTPIPPSRLSGVNPRFSSASKRLRSPCCMPPPSSASRMMLPPPPRLDMRPPSAHRMSSPPDTGGSICDIGSPTPMVHRRSTRRRRHRLEFASGRCMTPASRMPDAPSSSSTFDAPVATRPLFKTPLGPPPPPPLFPRAVSNLVSSNSSSGRRWRKYRTRKKRRHAHPLTPIPRPVSPFDPLYV